MSHLAPKPPSDYALQVWNMVARRGMTPALAARALHISPRRVERIVIGVSRRNALRWHA
jgi:plasmid maintenance system antidote protein VapI